MSAIVSGNGLGLFNSSASQIGRGLGASAGLGQGKDEQYVNIATGNLVLRSQDEQLTFRGLGLGAVRTYNSRGQLSDSGADAWITGFERQMCRTRELACLPVCTLAAPPRGQLLQRRRAPLSWAGNLSKSS